jgi:hypothetical protein
VAWGALAGLAVGSLPFGISTPTSQLPIWQVGLLVAGPMTLLGALSAAGSLALARRSERLNLLDASGDVAGVERSRARAEGRLDGRV